MKNISFPNHEPTIKDVLLSLLNTDDLDHQSLWRPWLSLILNDPALSDFQNLMNGKDYDIAELEKSLDNLFFVTGLQKLTCTNMDFEKALKEIKSLIDDEKLSSPQFIDAFNIYNARTENMLSDTKEFALDHKIDKTILSLSSINDTTSQDVKDQYEHSPYPRWTSHHIVPPPLKKDQKAYDHLIAGCGTGFSSCMTAMLYPHARINRP